MSTGNRAMHTQEQNQRARRRQRFTFGHGRITSEKGQSVQSRRKNINKHKNEQKRGPKKNHLPCVWYARFHSSHLAQVLGEKKTDKTTEERRRPPGKLGLGKLRTSRPPYPYRRHCELFVCLAGQITWPPVFRPSRPLLDLSLLHASLWA